MKYSFSIIFFLTSFINTYGSWPHWRGPNFNGTISDGYKYPLEFDKENSVKWSYTTPGPSASTPAVNSNRIFLSSIDQRTSSPNGVSKLLAICLDKKTGKEVWVDHAGSGYQPGDSHGNEFQLDSKSNYASPSPVVGKQEVVFFFGNGDLICYELDGKVRWRRNLQADFGDFCFQWTFSASPTIFDGALYLPVLQRDQMVHGRGIDGADSYLVSFNLLNGQTNWKISRETEARMESRESFSSIIPYDDGLLVAGGDFLTCHSPLDGKELWRWGTWNPGHKQEWWRLVPSPVVGNDVVLVCAPKGSPVYAVKIDDKKKIPFKLWDSSSQRNVTSDVPTPLFLNDHFFILSDLRKTLAKVETVEGKIIWETKLPGKYKWRSSPSGADGKIYLMNHNAHVFVLSSETGNILNSAKMGDEYDDSTRSSIALSSGCLFIRTNKILYCIEE